MLLSFSSRRFPPESGEYNHRFFIVGAVCGRQCDANHLTRYQVKQESRMGRRGGKADVDLLLQFSAHIAAVP